jgi:hypothetical protein
MPHVWSRRAPAAIGSPRFNVYLVVHKALRMALSETLVAAGRVDPHDETETGALAAQVRALLLFCRTHLDKEEAFVHPAIEARSPGSSAATHEDHQDHLAAFQQLEAQVRALETAIGSQREIAAAQLYLHLGLFVAENLAHMHVEETDNNEALWATYDDAELHALEERIAASIPQDARQVALRFMASACDPVERATFLRGVRSQVPPAVFEAIVGSVQAGLTGAEREKLTRALAQ